MVIKPYKARGEVRWYINGRIRLLSGEPKLLQARGFVDQRAAQEWLSQQISLGGAGKLNRKASSKVKGLDCWELYQRLKGEYPSKVTDQGRWKHLSRHLGMREVLSLGLVDLREYRLARAEKKVGELTRQGTPPTSAQLDREIELLRRLINFSVASELIPRSPISEGAPGWKDVLLNADNTRSTVISEEDFAGKVLPAIRAYLSRDRKFGKRHLVRKGSRAHNACPYLEALFVLAFDCGLTLREVTHLQEDRLDRKEWAITLYRRDTKGQMRPRKVFLTPRSIQAMKAVPTPLARTGFLFANPRTGRPFSNINKARREVMRLAGFEGAWFHDLRRSFVTNRVDEGHSYKVVMSASGHRTERVFRRYNILREDAQKAMQDRGGRHDEGLMKVRENR